MANLMKVDLSLNARSYSDGIKECKEGTEQYNNQVTNLKKNLPSLNKELAKSKKEAKDLALAVANLTEEQKRTAEGRNMIKMLQEAQKESARLLDISIDTNNAMKRLASDTFAFDVLKDSINGIGSAFTAVSGTIGLVTGEEDKMKQAMTGLATTMGVVNGLTSVQNLLQKESSVMLAISALQSKAKAAAVDLETAAQGKNIVATKSATAAQAALNLVADANPYVLLASAVIALVGAYAMFSDEINKAIGISNGLTKTENELREELKNQSSELAKTTNNVYKLSDEWKGLKTEAEQKQWIEDNQAAFDDLGISINSVTDAENVFVKNTPKLLAALEARTMAAAYDALANKKLQEAIDKGKEADIDPTIFEKGLAQAKSTFAKITSGNFDRTIEGIGEAYSGILLNTILNDKKLTNHVLKERHDEILELTEQSKEYLKKSAESLEDYNNKLAEAGIKQANKNRNKTSKTPKSSSKTNKWEFIEMQDVEVKDLVIPSQTKAALQKKLQKMQTELDTKIEMYIDGQVNPKYEAKLKEIKALQDKINNPQDPMDKLNADAAKSIADGIKWSNEALQKQEEDAQRAKEATIQLKEQGYDALANAASGLAGIIRTLGDEETAQAAQFAVNTAMMIADTIKQIGVMQASALTAVTESGAKLPFPANIAAIATGVATVLSIFSSLPKFEEGGIVGGHSFKGDKILARVNSGERILTKKQNDNLDKALDYNKLNANINTQLYGTVTVKGSDLNIAMKNFDKTQKKSR